MFHIHNGDASADTAKQSELPGEHFAFREALIEGPNPTDVTPDEWRTFRARHLSDAYGVEQEKCERDLFEQEQKLESARGEDEIVLWFEHDLFCQVNLIYLLNWFAQREFGKTQLSLICINQFPGKENFRGLGELNPSEIASLFPARQQVTKDQLNIAKATWQAYCSSDPTEIEKLLETDTSVLPFLSAALEAHLRRFPSTKNGLGRIENHGLGLISSGSKRFGDLFARFGEAEPAYGLGDAQFWMALRRMSDTVQPLLTIDGKNNGAVLTPEAARESVFEITDLGDAVLKGNADFVMLNGIEHWLGGVYLNDEKNLWRWDEDSKRLKFG